jgi:hypothetical protein
MANSDSQNPFPREWRVKYRAAILETNSPEPMKRLSDAERAIVQRMHELFRETGTDVEEERGAMDDAMYALRALKNALELKTRAA